MAGRNWLGVLAWAAAGTSLGAGAFLGVASNATSYMSDDPRACINCHVMLPEYATWQHSSHARVATCNDCHVPHDSLASKYLYKAKDGLRHSTVFTLRQEPQVIAAIPESRKVIQENCIKCHEQMVSTVQAHDEERFCVDCHRETPHGRVHSLSSTPNAAVPPLEPVLAPLTRKKP